MGLLLLLLERSPQRPTGILLRPVDVEGRYFVLPADTLLEKIGVGVEYPAVVGISDKRPTMVTDVRREMVANLFTVIPISWAIEVGTSDDLFGFEKYETHNNTSYIFWVKPIAKRPAYRTFDIGLARHQQCEHADNCRRNQHEAESAPE